MVIVNCTRYLFDRQPPSSKPQRDAFFEAQHTMEQEHD
jgi:hypothetical protein